MSKKEGIVAFFIFLGITLVFFYKFFFAQLPIPGDLLIAEYNPWKSYSFLGYNPGSYPNKAQYFDVLRQLYPWKMFSLSQLFSGELPLWNPYNFSGAPLLANFQSAIFYPFNILYGFLNTAVSWSILVFLQPLLASFFTYLYARSLKIGKEGAALSGIAYGFSHFMIVWLEYNTIGHVIAYLPLLLLCIEKLLHKKTLWWQLLFIAALVSTLFAGHIQIAGYIGVFVAIYSVFRAPSKQLFSLFVLFVLAIGIAAVQLLPGFELIAHSARANHDYAFLMQKILIQPYQLAMLFVPDFFGNPATRDYLISDTYIGKVTSIGLVGLFFASLSMFLRKNPFVRFFLITTLTVIILLTNNPITSLLYSFSIPIFSSSAPTLLTFLFCFSFSMLAGFGLDALQNKQISSKNVLKTLGLFGIIFLIMWILLFQKENSFVSTKALLYQSALLGIVGVFILGLLKFPKKGILIIVILLVIQTGEFFRMFHKFNPFVPADLVFPNTQIVEYLQGSTGINRFWGYKAANIEANFATKHSLFSPEGYDPLYPKRYGEFINLSDEGKLLSEFTTSTRSDAKISSKGELMENNSRLKVLDMLGTAYIVDRFENNSTEKDFPSSRFEKTFENSGWTVYKNLQAASGAFLTSDYMVFSGNDDFEKKFNDSSFNPTQTVLLEKEIGKLTKDTTAQVHIASYTPNKVVFKTQSTENQLLFLSDTFFPGWIGSVDGVETEILRANYAFRSIIVPKGNHTVVMEYKPASFRNGLAITLISLGILLALSVFRRNKGII